MSKKFPLSDEEKHEPIGVIIQSVQWASDAAVEGDDEMVNSSCDDIEDWLTELAFGSELN